jgi:hypothetical protein
MRTALAAVLLAAAGCGKPAEPTAEPTKQKLPPEAEFDPVTATQKYQAAKKSVRP